jgi:hypothetical protein
MGSFLIWLSGAEPKILRRCPTERPKYLGIGSAIFITAIVASVSLGFALRIDVMAPFDAAIPLAAVWGLAILALDRWLTVSLERQENPWRYLIIAIPRLILGLLFGFIIATPIVLQLFRPEISNVIVIIHDENAASYVEQLSSTSLGRQITVDQKTVSALNDTIATGGGPGINLSQDPTLKNLNNQLTNAQAQLHHAYEMWLCQLDGTVSSGVTCSPPGNGPVAQADEEVYQNDLTRVNEINSQIRTVEMQLDATNPTVRAKDLAEAKVQLPSARQALQAAESEQAAQTANFTRSNENDTGLLIRLQALDSAGQNGTLSIVRWLLFALFATIQCLPILVKVLLNLGPENTYEKMLALEEEKLLRAAREDILRRQAARDLE